MDSVNKTLYIPLYGKALVSQRGIILQDKKAEEIWEKEKFPLKGKSKSKWLAYYMAMRASVFDAWVKEKMAQFANCTVLHLGCGLDSRILRIGELSCPWYDVDFPSVIEERKGHFSENTRYRMLAADIREKEFLGQIPTTEHAVVVMEGISMYLTNEELKGVLSNLTAHFSQVSLLADCYTPFAAKMSKIRNPINDVGVTQVYGVETAEILTQDTGLKFIKEHEITPKALVDELQGVEKFLFKLLYAGGTSKKLYKLYEYES